MCGRTSCALCAEDISKACTYKDKNGKYKTPQWQGNHKSSLAYQPSHNIAPTDVLPVLVAGAHFNMENRILQPMIWGMIPPWHKGEAKSHGLTTHNCRLEGLLGSKLYAVSFNKGSRCVVVCDGFYEWQTTKGKKNKQPYFIYMPQSDGVCIEDPNTWELEWNKDVGWKGPRLLLMAGLFDVWISPKGEEILSCTVITMESNESLSWLHHRMPAILDTSDKIDMWLDGGKLPFKLAFSLLKPVKLLKCHPVDTLVNNSCNKSSQCNNPVKIDNSKCKNSSSSLMESWLKRSSKGNETSTENLKEEVTDEQPSQSTKKIKLDSNMK